ncbi:hypothetical protein OSU_1173 [Vibrio cholerae PS15]|nr:hypothetical protein OSU_1173 [Vibrio cholerae PS15]
MTNTAAALSWKDIKPSSFTWFYILTSADFSLCQAKTLIKTYNMK